MLPRWHVIFGAVFTAILWAVVPGISPVYLGLVFFASFLIDFDHYASSVLKAGTWKMRDSFEYHRRLDERGENEKKRGVRRKGDFHLFHTVEFHALVGLLGFLWIGFFYIFVGMIFHSLIDILSLVYGDYVYRREYFFFNWMRSKI